MKVTRFIDRKLLLLVLGPVIRHLSNALSLYLAGQGLSSGLINQVEAALIAGVTLVVNVLFELRDQGNVAERSAFKATVNAYAHQDVALAFAAVPDPWRNVPVDYDPVRDKFERESG